MKKQSGFTLIELMIVVAIVGILAALALPAYQDYIVRSKMSEVMAELAESKTSVAEYAATNNAWPPSLAAAGISTNSKFIQTNGLNFTSSSDTAGRLEATLNGAELTTALNGNIIYMVGTRDTTTNEITWTCATNADTADWKYFPSTCRNTAS